MCVQLRVLLVAPELLEQVSVVCMCSAVSHFIVLEQLTRFYFTFVPLIGVSLVTGAAAWPNALHNTILGIKA